MHHARQAVRLAVDRRSPARRARWPRRSRSSATPARRRRRPMPRPPSTTAVPRSATTTAKITSPTASAAGISVWRGLLMARAAPGHEERQEDHQRRLRQFRRLHARPGRGAASDDGRSMKYTATSSNSATPIALNATRRSCSACGSASSSAPSCTTTATTAHPTCRMHEVPARAEPRIHLRHDRGRAVDDHHAERHHAPAR